MTLSKRRPDECSSYPPSSPFRSSMKSAAYVVHSAIRTANTVKTDTFDGKHAHPFHGDLSSRVPSRPRLQLRKWSRVRACLVTVTLAESELIYESNLTLEIEATLFSTNSALMSWRVYIMTGNRLSISGSSYVRACLIIASWTQGTGDDSWGTPPLEVYTPFEDKYMRTGVKTVNFDLDGCQSAIWMPHIVISTSMMLINIQGHRCCTGAAYNRTDMAKF
ncbi:hypothetical protein ARMGADRAFT_569377 [Armillaria gallica]|uniref:Uncharacterized protein n=1 Tax=Armillaria gallica TaxID=47427 RepID=A0A2H3DSJ3_ARMGA|nr:hypothetical protein ARMGADRAFT_569377 [Armillaria gallica]